MATYNVTRSEVFVAASSADLFKVGFGEPAQNNSIVRDADKALTGMGEIGGRLALVNGPASLPAAVVVAHHLLHRYAVVGIFDPKMAGYVVAASHGGDYALGDLIPAAEVAEAMESHAEAEPSM